ncbi:MAG: type II toxin-antitoxin system VapC family toxin [Pyrinomonadaceae bacterium]
MTNDDLFLDTSGLLCLFDKADSRHESAAKFFRQAKSLFTSNYVLAEFIPLVMSRKLHRTSALFFLKNFVLLPRLELVWVDEKTHQMAMSLIEDRLDKNYSLCDAVSFVIMRKREISEALTTDKHFEQEGFIRLLK